MLYEPLLETKQSLEAAAAAVLHDLLQMEEGQALRKIVDAYRIITNERLPLEELLRAEMATTADRIVTELVSKLRAPSVKKRLHALLAETGREMTYDDVINEYERRGDPITGPDPKAALRTAATNLVSEGHITRPSEGVLLIRPDSAKGG